MFKRASHPAMARATTKKMFRGAEIDSEDDSKKIVPPDTADDCKFEPVEIKIEPDIIFSDVDVTRDNIYSIGTKTLRVEPEVGEAIIPNHAIGQINSSGAVKLMIGSKQVNQNISDDQKKLEDADNDGDPRSSLLPSEPPAPICPLCKFGYKQTQFLQTHFCRRALSYHKGLMADFKRVPPTEKPDRKCAICWTEHATAAELILHVQSVHCSKKMIYPFRQHGADSSYQCDRCERKFRRKFNWQRHARTHDKPKVASAVTCEFCGKDFNRHNSLAAHIRNSHSEHRKLPYECHFCEKVFEDRAQFEVHRQTHFECDICRMTFSRRQNLKRHRLTHNSIDEYGNSTELDLGSPGHENDDAEGSRRTGDDDDGESASGGRGLLFRPAGEPETATGTEYSCSSSSTTNRGDDRVPIKKRKMSQTRKRKVRIAAGSGTCPSSP